MFSSELLQDWAPSGGDEQDKAANAADGETEAASAPAARSGFSFWSVAAAVTSTVRKQASELVSSVAETDWQNEISAFGKEVSHDTHVLGSNALHMVDHLPGFIEHLPEQAGRALPTVTAHSQDVSHTLGAVGSSITQLGRSLLIGGKEIIEQVKDAVESEIAAATKTSKRGGRPQRGSPAAQSGSGSTPAKYSRFDAEVSAMQRDSSTYCDEPEEREEYALWKRTFRLEGAKGEVEKITRENPFMAELQSRIVPLIVEHDDFWHRYFYRLHKLQQKEEQRQAVAQMAKSMPEQEEELGWDDLDEVDKALAVAQEGAESNGADNEGDDDDGASSLADSSDIEAELRNMTPSPDPELQDAEEDDDDDDEAADDAGAQSPKTSGHASGQEALSTPVATLKGPASAMEEPQWEHAVEAVPSAPGDAAAQQPPAGPRPALAVVADAAAAGPAPSSSPAASSPSTSSPLTAPASQPQETAKDASGSAPPPSSSSAGATPAEPGRGALSPAAVAIASIAVGPVVEDPAESSCSQDGHGEESGLRKDPSLDTFGSDTSREWSLVSAGAGSSATSPSTQPAPALAAAAAASSTPPTAPSAATAAEGRAGSSALPAASVGSSQRDVKSDATKAGKEGNGEDGEEGDDDDDLDLEGLGEGDDNEDDGEEVDEDWGSWN